MNILWLHQYFATPQGWGAARTYELARRFVRAGHAVDVICCAGYDASLAPTGSMPTDADGVRVFVSGTPYRPHMGFIRRILSFLRFTGYALWFVVRRGRRYDVIIASSGPLTLALPALTGRWLFRTPFVFEVIDVWPDSAIAAGVLRNPILKAMSFRVEALAYAHAAAIVTCSTGMTARVAGKLTGNRTKTRAGESGAAAGHRPPPPLLTIPNGCDVAMFAPDETRRRATRERLGVAEGQLVAFYAGAMGVSNAVDDLVEAVERTARDDRVIWWIAGDGAEAGKLKHAIGQRGRWFGTVSRSELPDLYAAADVNVVTFRHEPLFFENSPNKFFDGLAAGLPAVFNRSTWLAPWLETYACGLACDTDAPGAWLAGTIQELAADQARLQRMKRGARRLAEEEEFNRDRQAQQYLDALEQVRHATGYP